MLIRPSVGLLIVTAVLLSQCTSSQEPTTAAGSPAPADTATVTTGQVESLDPDPNKPYREMAIEPVGNEPNNYSASVVCKRDSTGIMLLELKLDPSQHSIERLTLSFGQARPQHTVKQIGDGIGHYDAESQRYYFSTYYQVTTQLPNNYMLNSDLYPVHGWVSTRTNTLGLQL